MSTEVFANSKVVVRTYHKKPKRKRDFKSPTKSSEAQEGSIPTDNNTGGCGELPVEVNGFEIKIRDCERSQSASQSPKETQSFESEHPVEDASTKLISNETPEITEEQSSTPEEFFTPPSSPIYSQEPIHFWATDFLECYGPGRNSNSDFESVSKQRLNDNTDGLSDAERLFMELERRFYSEPDKKPEQDSFHDVQETIEDEKTCCSPCSTSETSSLNFSPEKQSCVSPQQSDGENENILRRSKRKFKTKRSHCLGCVSCKAPKTGIHSSRRLKNRV